VLQISKEKNAKKTKKKNQSQNSKKTTKSKSQNLQEKDNYDGNTAVAKKSPDHTTLNISPIHQSNMGYVGDWRPHRPRGAIGAHFKSPGPKYSLPSTIGMEGHDGRKKQAPAHSFGMRHAKFSSDVSPGPGAYAISSSTTRKGTDGTPKYSLYGRHKDISIFSTPGPGAYFPENSGKSAYYSAPTYSLSGRTKGHSADQSPGKFENRKNLRIF